MLAPKAMDSTINDVAMVLARAIAENRDLESVRSLAVGVKVEQGSDAKLFERTVDILVGIEFQDDEERHEALYMLVTRTGEVHRVSKGDGTTHVVGVLKEEYRYEVFDADKVIAKSRANEWKDKTGWRYEPSMFNSEGDGHEES